MSLHLHLDPFSGIAGDMFLGALLDIGLELAQLQAALEPLAIEPPYLLSAQHVLRRQIRAVDFQVQVSQSPDHGHHHHDHHHHAHPHRHYADLAAMIDHLDTSERGRRRARQVLDALAEAEATVHGVAVERVHFHEVGAVDSIVDLFGAAVGLELLGVDSLSCGPLPVGNGFVDCAHGRMPLPAPATAHLLRGLPTFGVNRQVELVTPTGAAIVKAWCGQFGPQPAMNIQKVGHGAGDRDDPQIPNVLRVFLGRLSEPTEPHGIQ